MKELLAYAATFVVALAMLGTFFFIIKRAREETNKVVNG